MGTLIARYPCATELNTFDFFGWQAQVAAMGATEIVFDTSHGFGPSIWPPEVQRRRFDTIIAPGPAMLGIPSREGTDGEQLASSRFRYLCDFADMHPDFPRLRSVSTPARGIKYTVTLRNQAKSRHRNSNAPAWRIFAKEIGAVVIEDFDDKPIHVHERMSLYAGAEMNFGITCGPLVMCSLSAYPCALFGFGWEWGNGFLEKAGLRYGQQMPWMGKNQFAVWDRDHLDTIREWFREWRTC